MKRVVLVANTSWYFYNFRLGFIECLRDRGYEVNLVAPEDEFSERLRAKGFTLIPLKLNRRSMNPLQEFLSLSRLFVLYLKLRPDFVHHYTVKCVLYGTIAAGLAGVPRVMNSVTGLGHLFLSEAFPIRMIRAALLLVYRVFSLRRGVHFLFQNADDLSLFRSMGILREGAYSLIRGSGVDTVRFAPAEIPAGGKPVLLFASRLLREKGLYELIEALRSLRSSGMSFEFRCAGAADSGNPSAIPEADLTAWRKEGIVTYLGHVDRMEEEIRAADVVLLPSWREGVPKILLEAASAGKAILASDVPGCREVVEHGRDGWLVAPRSAAAIEAGLRALLSDPELRKRLGTAAREKATREFDQSLIHEKTIRIYEELFESIAGSSPALPRS